MPTATPRPKPATTSARRGRPSAKPETVVVDTDFLDSLPPLTEDEIALQSAIEKFEKEGFSEPPDKPSKTPDWEESDYYGENPARPSETWSGDDEETESGLLPKGINPKHMKREEGKDRRKDHWVCTQVGSAYFGRVFAMPAGWNPSMGNFPPKKQVNVKMKSGSTSELVGIDTSSR